MPQHRSRKQLERNLRHIQAQLAKRTGHALPPRLERFYRKLFPKVAHAYARAWERTLQREGSRLLRLDHAYARACERTPQGRGQKNPAAQPAQTALRFPFSPRVTVVPPVSSRPK
jgi:hypothetical protein